MPCRRYNHSRQLQSGCLLLASNESWATLSVSPCDMRISHLLIAATLRFQTNQFVQLQCRCCSLHFLVLSWMHRSVYDNPQDEHCTSSDHQSISEEMLQLFQYSRLFCLLFSKISLASLGLSASFHSGYSKISPSVVGTSLFNTEALQIFKNRHPFVHLTSALCLSSIWKGSLASTLGWDN